MKCLLVYGTLSGSTMTAAELIGNTLKTAGHEVEVVPIENAAKESLVNCDVFIVGSPSWEDQGKDGQPLPEITAFLSKLSSDELAGKKVFLFGLGDVAYPHFCGAVDVIEGLLKDRGVIPIVPSLRIDKYYSSAENEQKVISWAQALHNSLQ